MYFQIVQVLLEDLLLGLALPEEPGLAIEAHSDAVHICNLDCVVILLLLEDACPSLGNSINLLLLFIWLLHRIVH